MPVPRDRENHTPEEIEQMAKISDAIIEEILREERWMKKLKGCNQGSTFHGLCPEWIDNHMGSIRSENAHEQARLEHFMRIRGRNA